MVFISKHRDEAIQIVSKRTTADTEYLRSIWDEYSFNLDNRPYLIDNLQRQEKWAKDNNIIDNNEKDINWIKLLQQY